MQVRFVHFVIELCGTRMMSFEKTPLAQTYLTVEL